MLSIITIRTKLVKKKKNLNGNSDLTTTPLGIVVLSQFKPIITLFHHITVFVLTAIGIVTYYFSIQITVLFFYPFQ